jgi:subtilase family serine protease
MLRHAGSLLLLATLPLLLADCTSRIDDSSGPGRPRWATADREIGAVDATEPLRLQIHLRMRDEQAAMAELQAISDPDSPRYGQFLSNAQFDARYAPTEADVAEVRAHLEANGLRVTFVPDNRAFVSAEGPAAAVERAFGTHLARYQVGTAIRRAATSPIRLPAHLDARVLTVLGVSTPVTMKPHKVRVGGLTPASEEDPQAAAGSCSQWFGQIADTSDPPYAPGWSPLSVGPCGYYPPQLRKAYGFAEAVENGFDGTGVNVAIVDAWQSPTLLIDAQTYAAKNDPAHPLNASQFSATMAPGTPTPPDKGWYGEQILDVEAVHAMAPGANIHYVGAQSADDPDLIAAINLILTQNLATIVSNSYGDTEADTNDFDAWHSIAIQAGLKGVGLYFSSGDDGDESGNTADGKPSADFPASLDNATAVGGTSLAIRQDGQRLWELAWATGESRLVDVSPDGGAPDAGTTRVWQPAAPGEFVYGSGGGTSTQYAQPWYQRLLVPRALATVHGDKPMRVVPDVAMLGDPDTGFVVGQTSTRTKQYREGVIGGTSLASPLFAGVMALAEQHASRSFGFANPLFYRAYWLFAFRDVAPAFIPKVIAVPGRAALTFDYPAQTIRSAFGYDNVTGLGTPEGVWFLWATNALTPPPMLVQSGELAGAP